ncbi:MAG: hypothetical protein EPN93_20320 [Spirochaetes bacterium]|nr:MAG: hypothetical protein EPN93_20320 [Spirochaetota bacterium]
MLVSAGGGYFRALGDIGGVLDPGYSFRAFIQGREPGDPLAVGFELDFAPLKDKENAGGITYISALPSLALVFTPVSSLDIQLRAAAGLTLVRSVIARETDSVERSSLDFTVGAGAGIWKTFGGRYAVGLETQYLYYFEKTGSSSLGAYLCAGYRFD